MIKVNDRVGIKSSTISRRVVLRMAASATALYSMRSWAQAGAIAQAQYIPIGGIEQWVQIRGDDRDNPALLWLNGGPGYSTIPDTRGYREWERHFTVVMWDQRGEGKTFERSGKSVAPTMTISRMAEDGIEVAEYLCRHLHQRKIILLGHSWGSILGIHMIKLRPDLFSAYVGTGQIVNLELDAEVAYPRLLERAKALNNTAAIKELEAAGPPPYPDSPKKWVWVRWANALDPQSPAQWAALQNGKRPPPSFEEGADFSQGLMWNSMLREDLRKLGLDFKVPIFFVQGAADEVAVTAVARQYFDQIQAPRKQFIVLPRAGHLAIFMDRDDFLAQLLAAVRPLAIAAR
jgi:pimeloyl-ACP methyl ester carboxylesterase